MSAEPEEYPSLYHHPLLLKLSNLMLLSSAFQQAWEGLCRVRSTNQQLRIATPTFTCTTAPSHFCVSVTKIPLNGAIEHLFLHTLLLLLKWTAIAEDPLHPKLETPADPVRYNIMHMHWSVRVHTSCHVHSHAALTCSARHVSRLVHKLHLGGTKLFGHFHSTEAVALRAPGDVGPDFHPHASCEHRMSGTGTTDKLCHKYHLTPT